MATSEQEIDRDWARRMKRILIALVLMPILIPAGCIAYVLAVPSYSASVELAQLKTIVSVRLYRVAFGSSNGRHVTVQAPGGSVTFQPCGSYWTFDPSTRLYRVDDRTLAIRGFEACHSLISLDTARVEWTLFANPSDWILLGAFTIATDPSGTRDLRFGPATAP